MGFNFHMIGMAAVVLAIIGFLVYQYRKKNNRPLVVNDHTHGYAQTPYGREFPTDCPCGCGLHWAGDMPYPPHYTTPPYVGAIKQKTFQPVEQIRPDPPATK